MSEIARRISIYTDGPHPLTRTRQVSNVDIDFAETAARQWAISENLDGEEGHVFVRYAVIGYGEGSALPRVLRAGEVAQ